MKHTTKEFLENVRLELYDLGYMIIIYSALISKNVNKVYLCYSDEDIKA